LAGRDALILAKAKKFAEIETLLDSNTAIGQDEFEMIELFVRFEHFR